MGGPEDREGGGLREVGGGKCVGYSVSSYPLEMVPEGDVFIELKTKLGAPICDYFQAGLFFIFL